MVFLLMITYGLYKVDMWMIILAGQHALLISFTRPFFMLISFLSYLVVLLVQGFFFVLVSILYMSFRNVLSAPYEFSIGYIFVGCIALF